MRCLRAFRIVAAMGLVVVALAAIVPMTAAVAAEDNVVPAKPICADGTTYNAAAGLCQRPAILACPTGMTASGNQCVAPSWCPPGATGPDRGTCTDPNGPNGPRMTRVSCPGYSQAIGDSNTCTGSPTYTCPAGQTMQANQICTSPLQGWRCPPGGVLSGTNCIMPAKAAAPAAAPAASATPDVAAAGRPSSRGLQLAATGSSRSRSGMGMAGWALAIGGLLLVAAAEPRRRRSGQRA
jgi:hypothetical protein